MGFKNPPPPPPPACAHTSVIHSHSILVLVIAGFALLAHHETSAYSQIASQQIPFLTNGVLLGITGFSLGILLGKLKKGCIKSGYFVSLIWLIILLYYAYLLGFCTDRYEMPYYALLFSLLVYFSIFQDGIKSISDCALFKRFGAWSYSIYLMQFPCFHYYELLIDYGVLRTNPGMYVVMGLLICTVVGILVYYMVERPVYSLYLRIKARADKKLMRDDR